MTSMGFLIIGGMLGYIFGYATAILMTMAKRIDEESENDNEQTSTSLYLRSTEDREGGRKEA